MGGHFRGSSDMTSKKYHSLTVFQKIRMYIKIKFKLRRTIIAPVGHFIDDPSMFSGCYLVTLNTVRNDLGWAQMKDVDSMKNFR